MYLFFYRVEWGSAPPICRIREHVRFHWRINVLLPWGYALPTPGFWNLFKKLFLTGALNRLIAHYNNYFGAIFLSLAWYISGYSYREFLLLTLGFSCLILPFGKSIYIIYLFISVLKFFCCFLLLGNIFTLNLQQLRHVTNIIFILSLIKYPNFCALSSSTRRSNILH